MTASRRPNIVFVLSDDHGYQAIGAYGSRINETPRIDEIAAAGVRLDTCICTNSLCTPSRAALLTGTYSHVNGVTTLGTPIDATQSTFISALRESGYRTAIVGKWHMGHGDGHDPQGFDYWQVLDDQGEYWDPHFIGPQGRTRHEGYATNIITDLSLEWMAAQDDPWCILIWHKAPHRSWEPDDAHADMYTDPIPRPWNFHDDMRGRGAAAHHAQMRIGDCLWEQDLKQEVPSNLDYEAAAEWKYQRFMEDYLRCVASVDDNVGRVTDWLREQELYDDTVMIYGSDQGFFLGEHGWFDKRFMYEESLRMPMLVSYPRRIPAGTATDALTSNVDLAPTLLDLAGVDVPDRMQGTSLVPLLTGDPAAVEQDAVYYRYYENDDGIHHVLAHYGIRTDRYKLIYYYGDGMGLPNTGWATYPPHWEMFDLEADPYEMRDVANDPAYASVRTELTAHLAQLQADLADEPHPSQGH